MQINFAQFLGALTAGFSQGLSAEAGIVTLESGDTFDVKANIQALQTLLMCASVDLKDAHEKLVQFIANEPDDEPYYHETRQRLLAVRQALEAIDFTGITPAPLEPGMKGELTILASAFKDVVNAADNGQPYTVTELTGPDFAAAREVMSKYDPENHDQASSSSVTEPAAAAAGPAVKVSMDGGLTYQPAPNGVRIIYERVSVPGEDGLGEVHLNATSEGLITDVWVTREEHLDHNIGTASQMLDDIVGDLVAEND